MKTIIPRASQAAQESLQICEACGRIVKGKVYIWDSHLCLECGKALLTKTWSEDVAAGKIGGAE